MPTPAECAAAWEKARADYLKTGRRPQRTSGTRVIYTADVPTAVKTAARAALAAGGWSADASVVLRRLAHQEKVSAAVIRRAVGTCAAVEPVRAWAELAAAALPGAGVRGVKADAPADVAAGIMVCLKLDDATASEIAMADGLPADEMHVTLAYLGKVGEDDNDEARFEVVEQQVRLYAQTAAPLSGEIAGIGEFQASDDGSGAPLIALVDIPGLNGWREGLVRNLVRNGAQVAENHGYTPHLTLGYGMPRDTRVDGIAGMPLSFSDVWLVWGEQWLRYPLEGDFTGKLSEQLPDASAAPAEEKKVRRVRTPGGMRLYDLPMGAIITRDPHNPVPPLPPAPYVGPDGKQPTPGDKTGDSAAAKAIVKSIEQRIAEGVDPAEAAVAYKKELHATRLRIQRARRKQEQLAAAAAAEDQTLDAGTTTKSVSSDEILAAATADEGGLLDFMSKPGDKAKALYGGDALSDWIGVPAKGTYSAVQMDKFVAAKGPGFVPVGQAFFDVLQHDTADGEYLPVLGVRVADGHVVKSGWAIRRDGRTYLIESGDAADDGGPSDDVKARFAALQFAYNKTLSQVPEDKRVMQRGVALLAAPNPADEYWAKKYNRPGFQSFATGGYGGTFFWNGNNPTPATVAHEFGHNLDSNVYMPNQWLSASDKPVIDGQTMSWADAVAADASTSDYFASNAADFTATRVSPTDHPMTFGAKGVTDYGQASPGEDFAESVRLYLKDKREGKLGFMKPAGGAATGTNVRFADIWPERSRILDAAFGLKSEYTTGFNTKQRDALRRKFEASDPGDSIYAQQLAQNFGLTESDVTAVFVAFKQAQQKKIQYDTLLTDTESAMQMGVLPSEASSDAEKTSLLHDFGGGENKLLTDADHVAIFDAAAEKYAAWKAAYDQKKLDLLEKHFALAKTDPAAYASASGMYGTGFYTDAAGFSGAEQADLAAQIKSTALGFAFESTQNFVPFALGDKVNNDDDEALFADIVDVYASNGLLKQFEVNDDQIEFYAQQSFDAIKAQQNADVADALIETENANAAKMSEEAAKAQAALLDITNLPSDVAQKIRKRKAFIKYKAKQPQKVTMNGATFWTNATNGEHTSAADTFGQYGPIVSPEDAVKALSDAYAGKTVTMKASTHYASSYWGVPKEPVKITGFALNDANNVLVTYVNSSGISDQCKLAGVKTITHEASGLSEADAQVLADEYERKAVQEALVAHLLGKDVSITGGTIETNDVDKTRPFKEATRRKGNVWLKMAGVEPKDKIDADEIGLATVYGAPERAKINLAASIAMRLDNPDNWEIFAKYAETYGIGSGPHGERTKQTLKPYEEYSETERRKLLYGEVAFRVRRWAGTSGDTAVGPLMMQKAAQEEFDLDSDYKARLLHSSAAYDMQHGTKIIEGVEKVYAERTGVWFRTLLRAMYDHTQASFKEAGITHVSLYRGMGVPKDQDWQVGTTVERARLQPINSWSTSKATANGFKKGGRVLVAEFPVERIVGSARTGFGCLNESEFVVMDTPGPVKIGG